MGKVLVLFDSETGNTKKWYNTSLKALKKFQELKYDYYLLTMQRKKMFSGVMALPLEVLLIWEFSHGK